MGHNELRASLMRKYSPNAPTHLTCRLCKAVRRSTLHITGYIDPCACIQDRLGARSRRKPVKQLTAQQKMWKDAEEANTASRLSVKPQATVRAPVRAPVVHTGREPVFLIDYLEAIA